VKPYFEAKGVALYHGDCRDVLPALEPRSVDLLLTDPPYGMQFAGGGTTTQQANIRGDGARQGVRVVRQALFELGPLLKVDAHAYVFCHWESWPDFYDACCAFFPIKNALIWWKNRGGMGDTEMEYARDYEVLLYGASGRRALAGRRDGAVLVGFAPVGNEREHPTEKRRIVLIAPTGAGKTRHGLGDDPQRHRARPPRSASARCSSRTARSSSTSRSRSSRGSASTPASSWAATSAATTTSPSRSAASRRSRAARTACRRPTWSSSTRRTTRSRTPTARSSTRTPPPPSSA
jgi:site-specific DNA-methyltransferase (adenine-specific)